MRVLSAAQIKRRIEQKRRYIAFYAKWPRFDADRLINMIKDLRYMENQLKERKSSKGIK
jgi:hypothetical protein